MELSILKGSLAQLVCLISFLFAYSMTIIHCCCCCCYRLLKIRCDQTKFVTISRAKKSSFQMVLEEMNKCAPDNVGEL